MTAKKPAKKTPKKETPRKAQAAPTTGAPTSISRTVQPPADIAERDQRIQALMQSFNEEGRSLIVRADRAPNPYALRRPTGLIDVDIILGGGFPAGGVSILSGPDNCVDGETQVHHEVRSMDGTRITHKWVTMERLYQRFHGLHAPGRGKAQKKTLSGKVGVYLAPSMNDQGGIVQNRIVDVICTGDKECFKVSTLGGHSIVCTSEHRFFDGLRYKPLAQLRPGDTVFMHRNTRREAAPSNDSKRHGSRVLFYVKHHPVAYKKRIWDKKTGKHYWYHVLPRARAAIEAHMNQMSLERYIRELNDGNTTLRTLTSDQLVHHIDEDAANDALSNLMVVTRASHMTEHLKTAERDNYFRFVATPETIITIRPVGRRRTYDLRMAAPFNNYVANKFVVHNSGKTRLLFSTMAMQQRLYGPSCRIGFGLAEGGFPFDQALNAGLRISVPDEILEQWQEWRRLRNIPLYTNEELLGFKQEIGQFYIFRGGTGEELLEEIIQAAAINSFSVIGVDSLNALLPAVDADKEMEKNDMRASHANLVTKFFKHYTPLTTGVHGVNHTTVLFTQQVRSNQERANAPAHIQPYLKPWAIPGAYAAKHFKLIDLVVEDAGLIKRGEGEGKEVIGKHIRFYTEKGKAGTWDNRHAETAYYYAIGGYDVIGDLLTAGIKRGIIRQAGNKVVVVRSGTDEVLPEFTSSNQRALRRALDVDFDLELILRREVLASAGIQCLYQ